MSEKGSVVHAGSCRGSATKTGKLVVGSQLQTSGWHGDGDALRDVVDRDRRHDLRRNRAGLLFFSSFFSRVPLFGFVSNMVVLCDILAGVS